MLPPSPVQGAVGRRPSCAACQQRLLFLRWQPQPVITATPLCRRSSHHRRRFDSVLSKSARAHPAAAAVSTEPRLGVAHSLYVCVGGEATQGRGWRSRPVPLQRVPLGRARGRCPADHLRAESGVVETSPDLVGDALRLVHVDVCDVDRCRARWVSSRIPRLRNCRGASVTTGAWSWC